MTEDGGTTASDGGSRPTILMRGERVALGPLHAGLLPWFARWANDPLTEELGGGAFRPTAEDAVREEWTRLLRGERAGWAGFAIYRLPDLEPIGHANLRDWPTPHRTAEFGITIGDPGNRGRGYGTEATRLVLRWAFAELGVHNVWLDTVATNVGAIRAYEKAGFREIGRIREARRIGGGVADAVLMDCLATEFRAGDRLTPGEAGLPPAGSRGRRPA
jgi:RimJ/RimL family protein N-acetyltransferase